MTPSEPPKSRVFMLSSNVVAYNEEEDDIFSFPEEDRKVTSE